MSTKLTDFALDIA